MFEFVKLLVSDFSGLIRILFCPFYCTFLYLVYIALLFGLFEFFELLIGDFSVPFNDFLYICPVLGSFF